MTEITNKFIRAQSHFITTFLIALLVTFVTIYFIPGSGTGWFSYLMGFVSVLSATIITQSFLGQILDYRSRNVPVARNEWVSAVGFYSVGLGIAGLFGLVRFVVPDFIWGISIGTMFGIMVPSLIVFISIRGLPWIEKRNHVFD